MSRRPERGAVLVETTLVVATALTLILFATDVGALGFFQISADAASFFDAHENVIGMTEGTPEEYTASLFKSIQPGDLKSTILPAPAPSVEVAYGYNAVPGQTPDPNSANERHGGVSMMQPVLFQVSVSPAPVFSIAGTSVGVSSQDTEPKWTECAPHYNVANEDSPCGDPSAPPDSAVSYADGENTPPYYVGYNLMLHCEDAQPWGDATNGAEVACAKTDFLALGVAAYLDTDNWSFADPGISGDLGTSVFGAAAFHQRVYAHIAQFLAAYPRLFPLYADYSKAIFAQLGVSAIGSPPAGTFADDRAWTGFATSNDGNPAKADPNGIDEAIACVYGWDQTIQSGFPPGTYVEPGAYPLHPEQSCPAGVTIP